jgi:hypothetical protein
MHRSPEPIKDWTLTTLEEREAMDAPIWYMDWTIFRNQPNIGVKLRSSTISPPVKKMESQS